jgi:hypothetical protein
MDEQQLEEKVRRALQYLIDEGLVVQEGIYYRMKTDEEIQEELETLLNTI